MSFPCNPLHFCFNASSKIHNTLLDQGSEAPDLVWKCTEKPPCEQELDPCALHPAVVVVFAVPDKPNSREKAPVSRTVGPQIREDERLQMKDASFSKVMIKQNNRIMFVGACSLSQTSVQPLTAAPLQSFPVTAACGLSVSVR